MDIYIYPFGRFQLPTVISNLMNLKSVTKFSIQLLFGLYPFLSIFPAKYLPSHPSLVTFPPHNTHLNHSHSLSADLLVFNFYHSF